MRFTEADGRKVVSTSTAETVGKVGDFVIDPRTRSVAAIVLKKTSGDGDTVPWERITAFGEDAVMVAAPDAAVEASGRVAELTDKRFREHNKRVLTADGVDLGKVDDVEFSPDTGAVTALILKDATVEGDRLMAVGSYAVVVRTG